ncbi:MAG TPA: NADH-quinone oxidoreductase subunit NuoK [Rectinemataceae bacterium]|nr:NADH-quinone oxidoreductase subunit NuoK [Rectinemataceae bacterium]
MTIQATDFGLAVAAIIFAAGLVGLLVRRNMLFMLLCTEIMLNAAGFAFIVAGASWASAQGQVMFIFLLAVAAAEVAVGLALVVFLFGKGKSLELDSIVSGEER